MIGWSYMEDNREHIETPEEAEEIGTEKSMGSTSGNEIEEQQRDQPQTEDTARLRLMEISKVVPPADEAADLNEEGHSHHQWPQRASSSSSARPDTEEEIRRKLMSISYSFDQPLSDAGQPVTG